MKPRIAILIPSAGLGGVERVMGNLAEGLRAEGVDADLLTLEQFHPPTPLLHHTATVLRVTQHLRAGEYTGLISAKERANVVAALARKAIGSRMTTVLTRHVPLQGVGRDSRWMVPHLYRRLYRHVDSMVGVSEGIAEEIRAVVGPDRATKVHDLPNPVIGPDFETQSNAQQSHPWLEDPDRKCIVTVGRLVPQKGLDLLIDALAATPDYQRPRWLAIGDGPERFSLETAVGRAGLKSDVRFVGPMDNPLPWIAAADAMALPSRYEGLPTVLIEALTLGTPCVAMDCPTGPAQIASHGGRIVCVADRRPDVFRDALIAVLADPEPTQPFQHEPFSITTASREYLRVLRASYAPVQ